MQLFGITALLFFLPGGKMVYIVNLQKENIWGLPAFYKYAAQEF